MATFTWIGNSGTWNVGTNWDLLTVPTSTDDAMIAQSGTNTVTVNTSVDRRQCDIEWR